MHQPPPHVWSILYRGPLSSCNYACTYCPFAKTRNTRAELEDDAAKLNRFVQWIAAQHPQTLGVLFTPWGEALIRPHYQEAMIALSHMPHVRRVAIQTNLSMRSTRWLTRANLSQLALWTTWHPTQVSMDTFLEQCARLDELGVRYSVGTVGLRDAWDAIEALRQRLNPHVYLWINAYKRQPNYYSEADLQRLSLIDPLFRYNARRHPSLNASCAAGHTAFSVDGDGTARRCHFIPTPIGNIYDPEFFKALQPRPCAAITCGCHIGYVHMRSLELDTTFGAGLLERIPTLPIWLDPTLANATRQAALLKIGPGPLPASLS